MKCNICNGKKWLEHDSFDRKIKCPYCDATGTRGSEYGPQLNVHFDVYDQWPDGDIFYEEDKKEVKKFTKYNRFDIMDI